MISCSTIGPNKSMDSTRENRGQEQRPLEDREQTRQLYLVSNTTSATYRIEPLCSLLISLQSKNRFRVHPNMFLRIYTQYLFRKETNSMKNFIWYCCISYSSNFKEITFQCSYLICLWCYQTVNSNSIRFFQSQMLFYPKSVLWYHAQSPRGFRNTKKHFFRKS